MTLLAAIAGQPETAFVVCNREEGGIAILSAEGEVTLSAADEGFLYRVAWGKDPLGLDEIEGRVVSAQEMLDWKGHTTSLSLIPCNGWNSCRPPVAGTS